MAGIEADLEMRGQTTVDEQCHKYLLVEDSYSRISYSRIAHCTNENIEWQLLFGKFIE